MASGALTAVAEGPVHAEYSHQWSSEGPGFSIGLEIPAASRFFATRAPRQEIFQGVNGGSLGFFLDSLPDPGVYAVHWDPDFPYPAAGERRVFALLMPCAGIECWIEWEVVDGEVRFARTPNTRDGLRAKFDLRFVRLHSDPPDTATVRGAFETR